MEEIKGLSVTVKFGSIEININENDLDVDSMRTKDQIALIKAATKAAADQVIEIQRSL